MERGGSLRDFMKHFGGIIHKLEAANMDSVMQVVKQVVRPNSQFFSLISLKSSVSINKLFKQANNYSAYEDDLVTTSKPTMVIGDRIAKSGYASS